MIGMFGLFSFKRLIVFAQKTFDVIIISVVSTFLEKYILNHNPAKALIIVRMKEKLRIKLMITPLTVRICGMVTALTWSKFREE